MTAHLADSHRGFTRRALLRSAAATATMAAGAVNSTIAHASTRAQKRFDLSQPSYDLFRGASLHSQTVPQGFAFDDVNGRFFVIQLTSNTSSTSGDLTITQLTLDGEELGYMQLTGFGHGVSIAAQPVGKGTYLWTETDANSNGYGTRLTCFPFVNGATLDHTSASLPKYVPIADGLEFTCAIDPRHARMAVRYHTTNGKRIAVFPLAEATEGNFSHPIFDIAQPAELAGVVFQGYTLYGDYLYTLDGTAYGSTNPAPGNANVSVIDLRTGNLVQRVLTRAGGSLTYREPEGMTVSTIQGKPRLYFGFASETGSPRLTNVFYKKVMV
ncbi:phage baseplate protein [Streptomyces sp. NBC_01727]|uniref:phage baseplate protein n=1 Tax=Streptomyces sp. NBC_01727 TaxID=2975924 RepID=UPI002E0E9C27|nr:teichoic acid biosynthesis protein C [Streptomyces sp. NBC_01727]